MNRRSFLVGMGAAGALGASSSVAAAPEQATTGTVRPAGRTSVLDFGADRTGAADSTAAILAAVAAAPPGGIVFFPAGNYALTGLVRIDKALALAGEGREASMISWNGTGKFAVGGVYGQKGTAAFLVTAGDVAFEGLTVKGPRRGKYAVSEGLIVATGTSSNARISGVRIQGCRLLDSGSAGILLIFVDRFEIVGNHIHFIGYEAVETISCSHGRVHGNHVHDIGPGVGKDMYGISFSHDSRLWPGDRETSPFSTDIIASNNEVENCPWEGITSHGGWRIAILGNQLRNVRRPLALCKGSGGATGYAGGQHLIANNCAEAGTYADHVWMGIDVNGGKIEHNRGVVVSGNVLKGYGPINSFGGVINAVNTDDVVISNNVILEWQGSGIYLVGGSSANVIGNVISGMAAPDKYGYGVFVEGNMPNVSVIANTLTKGAGVAPSVGLKALLQTTNPIFVGTNNFEEAATAPYQLTSARDGHRPNRIVPRTGDPTPSVAALQSGGAVVFQNGAESLAVKDFRGGIDGQVIHVSNTGPGVVSIDRGGNFALASASWRGAPYQTLSLLRVGSKWCEIGRSTSNA